MGHLQDTTVGRVWTAVSSISSININSSNSIISNNSSNNSNNNSNNSSSSRVAGHSEVDWVVSFPFLDDRGVHGRRLGDG